jgi:hypothetical protein
LGTIALSHKSAAPGTGRALRVGKLNQSRRLVLRLFPSDTSNVAAGDSNVGQFTVAQLRKFLHGKPISLPRLEEANNG